MLTLIYHRMLDLISIDSQGVFWFLQVMHHLIDEGKFDLKLTYSQLIGKNLRRTSRWRKRISLRSSSSCARGENSWSYMVQKVFGMSGSIEYGMRDKFVCIIFTWPSIIHGSYFLSFLLILQSNHSLLYVICSSSSQPASDIGGMLEVECSISIRCCPFINASSSSRHSPGRLIAFQVSQACNMADGG